MSKAIHSFVIHSFKYSFTANPSAGITPLYMQYWSFPCSSVGKESVCSAGDLGSIPRLRRSPGGGNGYPLQKGMFINFLELALCYSKYG